MTERRPAAPASRAVLVAALLLTGLIAGLFYAYACSVMPGLARSDDRTFVEAMRGINIAIVNPVFMLTFLGAPLLTAVAALLSRGTRSLPWLVAGLACLLAMVVITGAANIPLNNALESAGDDHATARARFENAWVLWNLLRALVSTAGFGCLAAAMAGLAGQRHSSSPGAVVATRC
ncbi:DUF1772 domain-containing protein [Allokutzneria multivorans]|uniref:DUF1772 domain-containing protein n=1 Tax=Allokutzneria multivorans TaxID=1142134 RepID=A0ABP7QXA4_9PSEU